MRNTLLLCAAGLLVAGSAAAQKDEYLDILVFRVKPEKRMQFDALMKRVAEANRRNDGDQWLAMSTEYGDQDTVTVAARRTGYADIDHGMDSFYGAMSKAFGKDGAQKTFSEINACLSGSSGEIRRRRWDLSVNAPDSAEAYVKLMGHVRWIRASAVHVKPGRALDYEAQLVRVKELSEKGGMKLPVWISQSVAGTEGTTYYVATYGSSLGAFDEFPTMRKVIGDENFRSYMSASADCVAGSSTAIMRIQPELSAISKEIAAEAPEFWTPKPAAAAAKSKAKPAGEAKSQ